MGWLTTSESEWVLESTESRPESIHYVVAAGQPPPNYRRSIAVQTYRMRNLTEEAALALVASYVDAGTPARADRQNDAGAYMVTRITETPGRWEAL